MEKRLLEKQKSYCHFGHEHPLKSTDSPPKEKSFCSACRLKISSLGNNKDYYTCKTCPYFLHNVCHNMPQKTQHPSHPSHYLTLKNSSSKQPLKCEACDGDIITHAYYYSCEQCGLCYHTLCSALPLLIPVSCHTHQLKLTFSPPYNFSCDICAKPSYGGWLYRCQICEFDSHLMCAISNRRVPSFPNALTDGHKNIAHSSLGVIGRVSVDYCNEVDEIIQLVIESLRCQQVNRADSGWDFRLQSHVEKNQKEFDKNSVNISPNPGKQCHHQSPLTPVSEETSTITSFQFSDACFSLDLGRSYSGYDQTKQASHDNEEQAMNKRPNVEEVEGSKSDGYRDPHEPNLEQKKELGSAHNYSFNIGRDGRLKEAFLIRNDTLTREELGHKGKSSQSTLSYKDRSGGSSWQKLICFCYTS